jgi:hypothetical protein
MGGYFVRVRVTDPRTGRRGPVCVGGARGEGDDLRRHAGRALREPTTLSAAAATSLACACDPAASWFARRACHRLQTPEVETRTAERPDVERKSGSPGRSSSRYELRMSHPSVPRFARATCPKGVSLKTMPRRPLPHPPATYSPEWVLCRPVMRVHPLRIALWERDLTFADASAILHVDAKTIKNVIAWRTWPKNAAMRALAVRAFGFKGEEELFPRKPRARTTTDRDQTQPNEAIQ